MTINQGFHFSCQLHFPRELCSTGQGVYFSCDHNTYSSMSWRTGRYSGEQTQATPREDGTSFAEGNSRMLIFPTSHMG
jgi:hypothetical protein